MRYLNFISFSDYFKKTSANTFFLDSMVAAAAFCAASASLINFKSAQFLVSQVAIANRIDN